jgi:ABC-2 type transport system ATP-binding protein
MATNGLAIDLHDVAKTYRGRVRALQGISMQVHRGEVFGLLGPNGAGKSTLVKIMMTVVHPTKASGTVLDFPVGHKPTLRRVGYLPEHHRFPRYLSGRQAIEFFGALSGVDRRTRRSRTDELLKTIGMADWGKKKVSSYSKGMMQRVGLAAALVNDPELILLDEPTDGVDPVGRREIRDILIGLKQQGKTVFLNSHLLSELEMICDRVAILVQGAVAKQGTLHELTRHSRRIEILVDGDYSAPVPGFASLAATRVEGATRLVYPQDDVVAVQPLLDRIRSEGRIIRSMVMVRDSLEDLFLQAVTDPLTGQAKAPGAARNGGSR